MKIKHLTILTLVLASTLAFVNAQEAPALPKANNTVVVQVAPAPSKPVVAQIVSDYEQLFPVCRLYQIKELNQFRAARSKSVGSLQEIVSDIDARPALRIFLDRNSSFSTKRKKEYNFRYNFIVWDGFIHVKTAGTYTFVVVTEGYDGAFAVTVNEKTEIAADAPRSNQASFNVDLKPGMNKLRFCVFVKNTDGSIKPSITCCPVNATGGNHSQQITPAILYHKATNEDW